MDSRQARPGVPRQSKVRLFKRDRSPFWYAGYVGPDGSEVRKSTKTFEKVKAARVAKDLLRGAYAPPPKDPGPLPITLAEALEKYCLSLEARAKPSAAHVRGTARKTTGRLAPPKPNPNASPAKAERFRIQAARGHKARWHLRPQMLLSELSPAHLEELVQQRAREGSKTATISHELRILRATVRLAEELGFAVPRIVRWRIPSGAVKTRFLSPEEFWRVFHELTPKPADKMNARNAAARLMARDLAVALVYLGGRWSEIAQLQWSNVDMDGRIVTLWGSKTQRMRVLPMAPAVHEVFARMMAARSAPEAPEALAVSPYVFATESGAPRVTVCRLIGDAMERAGLNHPARVAESGRATVHSLRHTHASWLLAGGADLSDVQLALGHTTMQMTRRYAHLSRAEAIRRLGKALEIGGPKHSAAEARPAD